MTEWVRRAATKGMRERYRHSPSAQVHINSAIWGRAEAG